MIYCQLESVLSGPLDNDTTTSADFPKVMDLLDALYWEWSLISTSDDAKQKQWWAKIFMLPRNKLVLVDDLRDAAKDSTLVSRCLNTCRLWVAAGGAAFWIDKGQLHNASGTNGEFLARCAAEALSP